MKDRSKHRGFTLLAVLVIVGSALLVATSMIFIAQAESAGASQTAHAAQSRALLSSGIEVVVGQLDRQRERILDGEVPQLNDQYELYETGRALGVVRLLPCTPAGDMLSPQAAMLDLNHPDLTAEMLASTGLVEQDVAERIIEHRDSRTGGVVGSIAELLQVRGVTPELLYGPLEDLLDDDTNFAEGDLVERTAGRFADDQPRGLADVLTVFAVEPQLQRDGVRRINLNVPWSEQLGSRLDERFGEGAGAIVKAIMDEGEAFDRPDALFAVLVRFDVPIEDWADILDALTTIDGTYRFGAVNINSASEAVLLALPTITPEQAAELIRSREMLSPDERASMTWPVMRNIIEAEAYQQLGPWLTNRSWTYRLRIAAGEVDAEDPRGPLRNPVLVELVIDLASPRPRIAYLRDTTLLRTAIALTLDEQRSNFARQSGYDLPEDLTAEEALAAPWPDDALVPGDVAAVNEEESWQGPDLADESDGTVVSPTEADTRRRLGRWRR